MMVTAVEQGPNCPHYLKECRMKFLKGFLWPNLSLVKRPQKILSTNIWVILAVKTKKVFRLVSGHFGRKSIHEKNNNKRSLD